MQKFIFILVLPFLFSCHAYSYPEECEGYRQQYLQKISTFKDRNLNGKTIFSGSSSILMWKQTNTYFQSLNPNNYHNRGFGGSQICHLLIHYKKLFLGKNPQHHPKRIVIYSGDNDLGAGLSAEKVLEHYKLLIGSIRTAGVKAPLYFITVKPSPVRMYLKDKIEKVGQLMERELVLFNNVFVINTFEDFFNSDGSIKEEYFLSDRLHLKPIVYKLWAKKLEALW